MPQPLDRDAVARARATKAAFVHACRLDVLVRKPGNVSFSSSGHGMTAQHFVDSAAAAAEPLCEAAAPVGRRIERAVAAAFAAAGCNANLGIVLLCAPLAAAAERDPGSPLHARVEAVLDALTVADAHAAYRAIAAANPGGLGHAQAEDVRAEPSVGLRAAMALAATRDTIARQYANGFLDLFAALDALHPAAPVPTGDPQAVPDERTAAWVQRVYLYWLARWPDSHIVRKHGEAVAHTVMRAAQAWRGFEMPGSDPGWAQWDDELKKAGVNPGTSADLTVATLMGWLLAAPLGGPAPGCGMDRDT
jgi:triphosphoribosyl-dephospho-CoA synthase